jgi:hypothetical protein
VNTSRQVGGALGLAILTSLAALYAKHLQTVDFRAPILALDDGFRLAYALGAALAAAGALVTLRFLPRLPQRVAPHAPPRAVDVAPAATTALAAADGAGAPNGGPASSARASASAGSAAAPSAGSAPARGGDAA